MCIYHFVICFLSFIFVFTKQKKDFLKESYRLCSKNEIFKEIFKEKCLKNPPIINLKKKRNYKFYEKLPPEQYENELKIWFKKNMKRELNLDNPKTLNEKIQWLKLYDATPIKTMLTDKYLVKNYIKEKIGEKFIIPLLGAWDSFNQINFKSLPNRFVLKTNHASGMVLLVKNKKTLNLKKIRKIINRWMKINWAYTTLELHYLNIKPKILAEPYIENSKGDLYDYKVYCFDGRVESIAFLSGKDPKKRRIAFFDTKWKKLKYTDTYRQFKKKIPKPKNLKLLINICEKLSKGFNFVRIDFYILNDGSIKFGEFTFTPFSGVIKFKPSIQDRIFGDMLKLPKPSPFPIKKK